MSTQRTLTYDEKSTGPKAIAFPPELQFYPHLEELGHISSLGTKKDSLKNFAGIENVYERLRDLISFISLSEKPFLEILRIAAMALLGDEGGLRLLYTLFMAIPAKERFIEELVDFPSTCRVMQRIRKKEDSGIELLENEKWFKQKISMLSISHPLPGVNSSSVESPWLSWSEGVHRAISDPDDKWDEAVLERAINELEAEDLRIRSMIASIDPDLKSRLSISLGARSEEIRWKKQILRETVGETGSSTLFLQRKLAESWPEVLEELRKSKAGSLLARMFEIQKEKTHTYPQLKNGAAVIRGLLMHPALQRTTRTPDILSCLQIYIESAADGKLEIVLPLGKKIIGITDIEGFSIRDRVLSVDLSRLFSGHFADENDLPVDVDWMEMNLGKSLSYKSLVMSYLDNDSFLIQLLNNPKATSKPGIVSLVAQRSRSLRVLALVANRRDLYTGFTNKAVPMNLIMNPAKIPLTTLRKFIHIRYVDKMTLIKLGQRGGGQVREEVRREIDRYLRSTA
ncbi:MAG: hypothetical protein JW814_12140 [Candidatus Krumholzibacteriota bacterium]|nr:hypothetical protein [Candidatus Krumholzibacteriota bacterium]